MKARDQDKEENQSNGEAPLPAVSANTLARCLGVTPKIIYGGATATVARSVQAAQSSRWGLVDWPRSGSGDATLSKK